MKRALLCVVILGMAARAETGLAFGKKPYAVSKLAFQVLIPNGWQAMQDHTGMVAQPPRQAASQGFQVSREPMLALPKTFDKAWQQTLAEAGIEAKVGKSRAGKYAGWQATWTSDAAGGRTIQVHRIRVPEIEMLYNFSFSAPKDADLKPLVTGVLRSFRVTAKKPELKFQRTATSLAARISMFPPEEYMALQRGMGLGMQDLAGFVRMMPGYEKPHRAGVLRVTVARGTDAKDAAELFYAQQVKAKFGAVFAKPRKKGGRIGKMKGAQLSAGVTTRDLGLPKRVYIFAGKVNAQQILIISLVVDDRDIRLHKNLFKEILGHLQIQT